MQRRTVLGLVAALAVSLLACSRSSSSTPEPSAADLRKLTVDEVAARIAANDGHTFVYDDNPKERWQKGHVPGARWVASGDVTADILPPDKSATLIFYCANEL